MDYINKTQVARSEENPLYPRNDIGIARLFFDLHSGAIRCVGEARSWYAYDDRRWDKDYGGFLAEYTEPDENGRISTAELYIY